MFLSLHCIIDDAPHRTLFQRISCVETARRPYEAHRPGSVPSSVHNQRRTSEKKRFRPSTLISNSFSLLLSYSVQRTMLSLFYCPGRSWTIAKRTCRFSEDQLGAVERRRGRESEINPR